MNQEILNNTLDVVSLALPRIYKVGQSTYGLDKLYPKALIQNGWKRIPFTEFNPTLLVDGCYVISSKDTNSKFNGNSDFGVIMFKLDGVYAFVLMPFEENGFGCSAGHVWEWFSNSTDDDTIKKVIGHYTSRLIKGYSQFKSLKTTFSFESYTGTKRIATFMMICDIDKEIREKLLLTMDKLDALPLDSRSDSQRGVYRCQTDVHQTIMFMGENDRGLAMIAMIEQENGEVFNKLGVTADCDIKESMMQTIENIIERPLNDIEKDIIDLFKHINRFQHITSF